MAYLEGMVCLIAKVSKDDLRCFCCVTIVAVT